jgi:hypothetical protein
MIGKIIDRSSEIDGGQTKSSRRARAPAFPTFKKARAMAGRPGRYLDSRIYGGYATTALNPEPYTYEGAFLVRWLIQDQLKGNAL